MARKVILRVEPSFMFIARNTSTKLAAVEQQLCHQICTLTSTNRFLFLLLLRIIAALLCRSLDVCECV